MIFATLGAVGPTSKGSPTSSVSMDGGLRLTDFLIRATGILCNLLRGIAIFVDGTVVLRTFLNSRRDKNARAVCS